MKARLYMFFGVSSLSNSKDARLTYSEALEIEKKADRFVVSIGVAALAAITATLVYTIKR